MIMSKVFGIDLSSWQGGYNYSRATKEGVKFAILRAGFSQTKDSQFETHYKNAKKQGWGVGAYWYTYAESVAEAKAEAKAFLKVIKGKKFEYPIYLDIEDSSLRKLGKTTLNNIVKEFGTIIQNSGYYFGVYTNVDWYRNKINGSALNKKYDWWIACWDTSKPSGIDAGMWQFGGSYNAIRTNKVAGVTTDQDYAYKDYPTIMKQYRLNGYKKEIPTIGIYQTLAKMNIRTGPSTKYKKLYVKDLVKSDKAKVTKTKPDSYAMYKKGIKFKVTEIQKTNNEYWGKGPSGWTCIRNSRRTFCKKI